MAHGLPRTVFSSRPSRSGIGVALGKPRPAIQRKSSKKNGTRGTHFLKGDRAIKSRFALSQSHVDGTRTTLRLTLRT